MHPTPRLRVLSNKIPQVLVFVYFYRGVIRKYGGKAHTSGLHRDINVCTNFLSSRRLQKPRERTEAERARGQGARPPPLGARPALVTNQGRSRGSCSTAFEDQGKPCD